MQFLSLSGLCSMALILFPMEMANSFALVPASTSERSSATQLFATKKKKSKKKRTSPGGGFGGASMEPCPCGSGETYNNCCSTLHRDVNAFKSATAEQVVRARYSAFAKKQPDFLMASTHPYHKDFDVDLKKWKESIKQNMYDNFDLPKCAIVEESYPSDNKAEIKFIAEMIYRETGEVTAFMETSTFERSTTDGRWLYRSGIVEPVPDELTGA